MADSRVPASGLPQSLYGLFRDRVAHNPGQKQFWDKRAGTWVGHELGGVQDRVRRLAARLGKLGIGAGDRVGIYADNSLEWVISDQATFARGGVVVPIYPTSTPEEARFILEDSKTRVVCASGEVRTRNLSAMTGVVSAVVSFDQPSGGPVLSLDEILGDPEPPAEVDAEGRALRRESLATIIYTSGTTARPKGVQLSHGNILSNVEAGVTAFPMSEADSCLSFLPLSHMFERTAGYYIMLASGVSIYYSEGIDKVPQNLGEVRPTVVISVPRLYEKVYARIRAASAEGSAVKRAIANFAFRTAAERAEAWAAQNSTPLPNPPPQGGRELKLGLGLRLKSFFANALVFKKVRARVGGRLRWFISGGAPLAPEIAKFFYGVGIPIQEGYGLTETSPIISANRPGEIRFGTVGRPFDGVEVKIAEDGEILTRGPHVMSGYLNLPEETAEALKGGWFHTGDIGELTAEGALRITDRKKSLIVLSNGKKVAPQEVEICLKTDPLFAQVVAWGDNRPFVAALIVPDMDRLAAGIGRPAPKIQGEREALAGDPAAVDYVLKRIEGLMSGLAPFKHVRRVYLHPAELTQEGGELTPTLKVKMRVIKERYGAKMEGLYAAKPGA